MQDIQFYPTLRFFNSGFEASVDFEEGEEAWDVATLEKFLEVQTQARAAATKTQPRAATRTQARTRPLGPRPGPGQARTTKHWCLFCNIGRTLHPVAGLTALTLSSLTVLR